MTAIADTAFINLQRLLAGQSEIKAPPLLSPKLPLDLEKKSKSQFEAGFYALLQVLNEQFQNIIEDNSIDERDKILRLSELINKLHLSDELVETLSKKFKNETLDQRLHFLEEGWEHRLNQQLLKSATKITQELDRTEKGQTPISAEQLYNQADMLESAYAALNKSSLAKSLGHIETLIVRLRKVASRESVGKSLSWALASSLQTLDKTKQETVRRRCLLDYARAVDRMEKVIKDIALQHPKVKAMSHALYERLFQVVQVHAEIEEQINAQHPSRVALVSEISQAIQAIQYSLLPELAFELQLPIQAYWKNSALENWNEAKSQEETAELFCRLIDVLEVYPESAESTSLQQNIEKALNQFLGGKEKQLKSRPFDKELHMRVKLGKVFGTERLTVAGSVGLSPLHFEKIQKEGNIREKLTAAFNAIMPPDFYFATLMNNETLVKSINRKLKGFSLDYNLAQKYKKMTGRLFNPKPGITKKSRAPRKSPLHKKTRIARREQKSTPGLTEHDISLLPLTLRERRTLTRSPRYSKLSQKELPWKTGRQAWEVQHVPLGKSKGFAEESIRYSLPVVAGPSGTTDRLFELAQYVGLLQKKEDFQVLRLTCLAYLLSIDAHSYHEVMLGAVPYGLPYSPGPESYLTLLTEDKNFSTLLKQTLSQLFPGTELPGYYLSDKHQIEVAKEI